MIQSYIHYLIRTASNYSCSWLNSPPLSRVLHKLYDIQYSTFRFVLLDCSRLQNRILCATSFLYFVYSTFSQICCVTYFCIYFFNYYKVQRIIGCYKSISLRFYYNLWSLWQKLLSLKRLRRCKLFGLKFRE